MSKCPIKTKTITILVPNTDEDYVADDTSMPEYIKKEINWPEDEHYWEIRGFFGKYKQCKKCQVCEV